MTTRILGLSAYYHDSAACLVVDGEIVAAAQEERFSRQKHDPGFPRQAVDYCLRAGQLADAKELDYVVFYDKPMLKFQRLLETYLHFAPVGIHSFLKAMPQWLKTKLKLRDVIKRRLGFDGVVLFTEHHEAHAASAFFPSPFDEAAILTIDGVGERATASMGCGDGNRIKILKELHFPHSLGLLYSAFTYFTGFKVNSGEYKLMGLAPFGEPRYVDLILDKLVDLRGDGSLHLNMNYFNYCAGLTMTNRRFADLFGGPPREPEAALTEREMDMARSIQAVTETAMSRMARAAHETTGSKHLVLAGGVALNCVGNGRLVREGPFEKIWIQPAAGDAGGALGAALFVHYQLLGAHRSTSNGQDCQRASLLGPAFGQEELEIILSQRGLPVRRFRSDPELVDAVSALLAEGKVVGWFQGRMEFGPRALGSRSILADPRRADMQSTLNLKIKFRESFRPFAPAVSSERAGDYFTLDRESPYMLLVCDLTDSQRIKVDQDPGLKGLDRLKLLRSTLPAITHIDNSARVQTVRREDHPLFHRLLERFEERTGCPVLVNTSFNVRGEPIVCTPEEALRCFSRTRMDALVLGPHLITREDLGSAESVAVENDSDSETAVEESREAAEARRFALIMLSVLLVLGAVSYFFDHQTRAAVLAGLAGLLALGAISRSRALVVFYRLWMRLAMAAGRLLSALALCAVYYFVLAPVGRLKRLLGRPSLDVRWREPRPTFWRQKPEQAISLERYRKLF